MTTELVLPTNISEDEVVDGIERFARVLAAMLEKMDEDQPTNRHSLAVLKYISKQLQEDKKDGLFALVVLPLSLSQFINTFGIVDSLPAERLPELLSHVVFGWLRVLGQSVLLCTTSETISYLME